MERNDHWQVKHKHFIHTDIGMLDEKTRLKSKAWKYFRVFLFIWQTAIIYTCSALSEICLSPQLNWNTVAFLD